MYIFQVGSSLTPAANAVIQLSGGITAASIYWVVAGAFAPGAGAVFQGIMIANSVSFGANVAMTGKH